MLLSITTNLVLIKGVQIFGPSLRIANKSLLTVFVRLTSKPCLSQQIDTFMSSKHNT